MILGTGIDIIEVGRVMGLVERFGDRFLDRILLPAEIAYCRTHARPGPHIAARFAAKEAVSKAFGTGIGRFLGWHDIEIARHDSGEPFRGVARRSKGPRQLEPHPGLRGRDLGSLRLIRTCFTAAKPWLSGWKAQFHAFLGCLNFQSAVQ